MLRYRTIARFTTTRRHAFVLKSGDVFFRWRSYLPLVLLPVMFGAIAVSPYRIRSRAIDLGWEIGCVLLALAGWAIRVYTVGVAAPGTSGRNTRRQKAAFLNTTGPYSVVRHPLYLANSIIAFALALFSRAWILPVVVGLVAPTFYALIAQREEQYLRERFGAPFDRWAARVPGMLPALRQFVPAERRFDPTCIIRREFYALVVILTMPMIIDLCVDFWETGTPTPDPVWTPVAGFGAATFLVLRFLKTRRRRAAR